MNFHNGQWSIQLRLKSDPSDFSRFVKHSFKNLSRRYLVLKIIGNRTESSKFKTYF